MQTAHQSSNTLMERNFCSVVVRPARQSEKFSDSSHRRAAGGRRETARMA